MARMPSLRLHALRACLRDFRNADKGAAAVEFAIVAMPFFALLGGVIELGLVFMAQISLDNAMSLAAREIRTGQSISASDSATQQVQLAAFKDNVCNNMQWMVSDCKSNLSIDVRTYSQFQDVSLSSPIQNGVFNPGAMKFDTGTADSIVVVRAYYQWTLFMPVLNQALQRTTGKTLLTSVTTFSNEPYLPGS